MRLLGVGADDTMLSPLLFHPLDSHALSSGAGEEVHAQGETDPQHTDAGEKHSDSDHRFHCAPPIVSVSVGRNQRTIGHANALVAVYLKSKL
jgi:hypothetical protein